MGYAVVFWLSIEKGSAEVLAFATIAALLPQQVISLFAGVLMQTTIEPQALGRAFSIYRSFTMLPAMIGLLQTGFVADRIRVPNTFIILGIVIVIIGLVSFFSPSSI